MYHKEVTDRHLYNHGGLIWGRGAIGSAIPLQGKGCGFKSHRFHQSLVRLIIEIVGNEIREIVLSERETIKMAVGVNFLRKDRCHGTYKVR